MTVRKSMNCPPVVSLPDILALIRVNDPHKRTAAMYIAVQSTRISREITTGIQNGENLPAATNTIRTVRTKSLSAIASISPPCQLSTCHLRASQPSRISLSPAPITSQGQYAEGQNGKAKAANSRQQDNALGNMRCIYSITCPNGLHCVFTGVNQLPRNYEEFILKLYDSYYIPKELLVSSS